MPPSRRRPVTPPARRPRVAGIRRPTIADAPFDGDIDVDGPDTDVTEATEATEATGTADTAAVDNPDTEVLPRIDDSGDSDDAAEPAEPERVKVPSATPTRRRRGAAEPADTADSDSADSDSADSDEGRVSGELGGSESDDSEAALPHGAQPMPNADAAPGKRRTPLWVLITLFAVVVACGAFSIVAGVYLTSVRGADRNTALTDDATTSQVVGQVTNAINTAFSYNYTNLDKTKTAVQKVLTGKAIGQYNDLFKTVEAQAPAQKLVLTITVQDIGVQSLEGDNAHLLVFANETSSKTPAGQKAVQDAAGAMISVDAVRQNGAWKISNIDLLT